MTTGFPLFPDQASTIAGRVDGIYLVLVGITAFFSTLIFVLVFYFAIKYRRKRPDEIPRPMHGSLRLELLWSIIPLFIALSLFAGGTAIFFRNADIPPGAMEIYVVGKQWMWKFQHPEGKREINELHVPIGRPVKLVHDVGGCDPQLLCPRLPRQAGCAAGALHDALVPADEGRHVPPFCAEYCGTQHSGMIGIGSMSWSR